MSHAPFNESYFFLEPSIKLRLISEFRVLIVKSIILLVRIFEIQSRLK